MKLYPKNRIPVKNVKKFIVIFYIVGLLGFVIPFSKSVFVVITPFALLLCIYLLAVFHERWNRKSLFVFLFIALIGFFVEVYGVKTGTIFGNYVYGKGLGLKLFDTPLIIGLNWLFLCYSATAIAEEIGMKPWQTILFAPMLMLAYDVVLEMVAPKLEMWSWQYNQVTVQNFVAWYLIGLVLVALLQFFKIKIRNPLVSLLFMCQFAFFALLAIIL